MFSKACEYGIRATIQISLRSQKGERISLKAVAEEIDSPMAFTAKILQSLSRHNLINSSKGPAGGYEISESANGHITLFHIVEAIDGDKIYNGCGLGLKECSDHKPCPVHYQFKAIRDELKDMLKTTTIRDLANETGQGLAFLKN